MLFCSAQWDSFELTLENTWEAKGVCVSGNYSYSTCLPVWGLVAFFTDLPSHSSD